jgi:hypothetical protein
MARGWESKSVEAQQEAATQNDSSRKPALTAEEVGRARELTSLQLSLKRILEQLAVSQNPRHRAMLELAKQDLEQKIESQKLNRSAHQTG